MFDSLPSEYMALIVYVVLILFIFVGALVWQKYRGDLKKKYFHYGDREDDTKVTDTKATRHHA